MVGSILTSLIYCVLIKSSFGVYKTFQKESSAPWSKLTVVDFGIAQGGKISVDYSITSPSNLTNPIYFLINIINEDMRLGWYDGASVTAMCEAPAISRHVVRGSGTIDYVASTMVDRYSLVAIQCWNKDMSFATTVDIDTSMTNLSPPARGSNFDKNPSHLPIEEVFLARMYLGFTILYAVLLAGIVGQLAVAKYDCSYFVLFTLLAVLIMLFIDMVENCTLSRSTACFLPQLCFICLLVLRTFLV